MNEDLTFAMILCFSISIGLCFGSVAAGLAAFFGSILYLGKN